MWKFSLLAIFLLLPAVSGAQEGLVPCGGAGQEDCQSCHVVYLIENIFTWLGTIFSIIFPIILIAGGIYLVSSSGDVGAKTTVRRYLSTVIVGYIIFMVSWILVDLGMKMMVNNETYSFWDKINCVDQPQAQKYARLSVSGYNDHVMTDQEINNIPAATGDTATDINNAAANNGLDANETALFKALVAQESTNCKNKVSPAGAYGCGQVTIDTAKSLDPSLKGLTNDEIKEKLINDDAYNLNLSAKNFNQLMDRYKNVDLALAAYNGGQGANAPSNDCPGQKRWQCVWDSPGCYNTGETDCTPNTGYIETRNYVKNINNAVN